MLIINVNNELRFLFDGRQYQPSVFIKGKGLIKVAGKDVDSKDHWDTVKVYHTTLEGAVQWAVSQKMATMEEMSLSDYLEKSLALKEEFIALAKGL